MGGARLDPEFDPLTTFADDRVGSVADCVRVEPAASNAIECDARRTVSSHRGVVQCDGEPDAVDSGDHEVRRRRSDPRLDRRAGIVRARTHDHSPAASAHSAVKTGDRGRPLIQSGRMQPLLFLGAGGHAREVAIVADAVDATHQRWSSHTFVEAADEHDALAHGGDVVIALGSPTVRLALWRRYSTRSDLRWPILIHPRADVGPRNSFSDGILIASGVITTNDISIGPATLVNRAVTIGHEVEIGAGCSLNPGVTISGRVTIGDGCLIGAGAIVLGGPHHRRQRDGRRRGSRHPRRTCQLDGRWCTGASTP